ncbi:FtsK/SpoIIIE domain-containing protein [Corynebacterium sp. CCM 9204]|uniref:FtsK/SpoIIIE domain-containing protein n=1 Tax=Corynebacterium sp. CCM 9204 TaxID=3057616 RepID=UPI0035265B49
MKELILEIERALDRVRSEILSVGQKRIETASEWHDIQKNFVEKFELIKTFNEMWGHRRPDVLIDEEPTTFSRGGLDPVFSSVQKIRSTIILPFGIRHVEASNRDRKFVSQRLNDLKKEIDEKLTRLIQALIDSFPLKKTQKWCIPSFPPGLRDTDEKLNSIRAGYGPLVLEVGHYSFEPVLVPKKYSGYHSVNGYGGSGFENRTFAAAESEAFPCVIDLVEDGGFATNDFDAVTSFVIRFCALLPANSVKIHLFDPVKLGGSLRSLNDLSAEALAKLIKISVEENDFEAELNVLLSVASRITQQCLGNRFASLVDYNSSVSSGKEPYHLLLLMDHPKGVTNSRIFEKISTLAASGPKAGIFTIVFNAPDNKIDDDLNRYRGSTQNFSYGLPQLHSEKLQPVEYFTGHTSVVSALQSEDYLVSGYYGSVSEYSLEDLSDRQFATLFDVKFYCIWHGPQWAPDTSVEVRKFVRSFDARLRKAEYKSVLPQDVASRVSSHGSADPADPSTWWKRTSACGLEVNIGLEGDRNLATISIGSRQGMPIGLIVAGQTNSGKSVGLHAIICDLIRNYPPQEVQLYLLDHKDGVEFQVYAEAKLPHARVVSIQAPEISTALVLQSLLKEQKKRAALFRKSRLPNGGVPVNYDEFRSVQSKLTQLPRIVVIVDEFQNLFSCSDDDISAQNASIFDTMVRQFRAFGIHLILSSQSLSGIRRLPSSVLSSIQQCLLFTLSDEDSRIFLGPQNSEATQLVPGTGQAILRKHNDRRNVQVALEDNISRSETCKKVAKLYSGEASPIVLDFSERKLPKRLVKAHGQGHTRVLLGRGFGTNESVSTSLAFNDDGNLLLTTPGASSLEALDTFSILGTILSGLLKSKVPVHLVDFGDENTEFDKEVNRLLRSCRSYPLSYSRSDQALKVLERALTYAQAPNGRSNCKAVFFFLNLDRSVDFHAGGEMVDKLGELIKCGPRNKVHSIVHLGEGRGVDRLFSLTGRYRFGSVLSGRINSDSSYEIFGSNLGSNIDFDYVLVDSVGSKTYCVPFKKFPPAFWEKKI